MEPLGILRYTNDFLIFVSWTAVRSWGSRKPRPRNIIVNAKAQSLVFFLGLACSSLSLSKTGGVKENHNKTKQCL